MTSMHRGAIAIAGASETARLGKIPDQSVLQLHAEAAVRALADAGITPAEIDGIANDGMPPTTSPTTSVFVRVGSTALRWAVGASCSSCATPPLRSPQARPMQC